VGNNVLVSAIEEVVGQERVDPETGWFYVLTFFAVMVR